MTRILCRLAPLATLSAALVGGVVSAEGLPRTVFRSVTVIPMDRPGAVAGQDVIVELDRIVAIAPAGSVPVQARDRVIEGGFLMPGLWDMHVHTMIGVDHGWVSSGAAFLSYGVVGVRDMGMSFSQLRELLRLLAMDPVGTEVVASGPMINGAPSDIPDVVLHVELPEESRALVRQILEAGSEFIKVHDDLTPETFFAVLEEARKAGVLAVGHAPMAMTAEAAAAAGLANLERISLKLLDTCTKDGAKATPEMVDAIVKEGPAGRWRELAAWYDRRDIEKCAESYRRLAQTGVFVTPMLSSDLLGGSWVLAEEIEGKQPGAAFFCRRIGEEAKVAAGRIQGAARALFGTVLELRRAGVPLLAGSEAPSWCATYGRGLHRELRLLAEAGLSNQEVLEAATINATRLLGRSDEGVVQEGARANLLLLEANPLEDVSNTLRIKGVMKSGAWYDNARLEGLRRSSLF